MAILDCLHVIPAQAGIRITFPSGEASGRDINTSGRGVLREWDRRPPLSRTERLGRVQTPLLLSPPLKILPPPFPREGYKGRGLNKSSE